MSTCRSACHRNNFRKSRVSDVSARILAKMSVSVSASWSASCRGRAREKSLTDKLILFVPEKYHDQHPGDIA